MAASALSISAVGGDIWFSQCCPEEVCSFAKTLAFFSDCRPHLLRNVTRCVENGIFGQSCFASRTELIAVAMVVWDSWDLFFVSPEAIGVYSSCQGCDDMQNCWLRVQNLLKIIVYGQFFDLNTLINLLCF